MVHLFHLPTFDFKIQNLNENQRHLIFFLLAIILFVLIEESDFLLSSATF